MAQCALKSKTASLPDTRISAGLTFWMWHKTSHSLPDGIGTLLHIPARQRCLPEGAPPPASRASGPLKPAHDPPALPALLLECLLVHTVDDRKQM